MESKKINSMGDLSWCLPDIYREYRVICHAQKKGSCVVVTGMGEGGSSFQVTGGSPGEAYANLMHKLGEK